MTTVVLGWDALDYELAGEFGLREVFGDYCRKIDTFENPILEEPHTMELWPTIITGVRPEEHGVWAKESEDRKEWENSVIDTASKAARNVLPKSIRTWVGNRLTEMGAEGSHQVTPNYYRAHDIGTVFDERRARSISVPNHRTSFDERHGFDIDRAGVFERITAEGSVRYELKDPPHVIDELLSRIAAARMGVVQSCLQYDYDLVFVWFGYLDTVGHLAPVVNEDGWHQRSYTHAARMTQEIRSMMDGGDDFICVSDHGLQDGKHTFTPYLGASDKRAIENIESVGDVRTGIERITPTTSDDSPPTVREAYSHDSSVRRESAEIVRSKLEDLGYI